MRVHLIDGTMELFRAHFSPRPEVLDAAGVPAKATYGFAGQLTALLKDKQEAVTHAAIAFDNPIRSFRNDLYAGYKSEEGVPAELLAQFDRAEAVARALGFVVWNFPEFEADDALATAARRFAPQVDAVRILSSDKDLCACLVDPKVVMVDRIRKREIDAAAATAARGVRPDQMPDYLALVGDSADGIPGIKGIGEKAASALLARYDRVENIPTDRWDIPLRGGEKLCSVFGAEYTNALLYKKLATLRFDVPLPQTSVEELKLEAVDAKAAVARAMEIPGRK